MTLPDEPTLKVFLQQVDSVCSLIAYRHPTGPIPPDLIEELKQLSVTARGWYEQPRRTT